MKAAYLLAWARQRFAPATGLFAAVFYLLALLAGRAAEAGPLSLSWRDLPGALALWLFFLWLRVLDEHKDFADDLIAHPDRVLQRGLVTLTDLRLVGAAALAVSLGVSLWLDGGIGRASVWWSAAFILSLLMAKEFFARDWLRRHLSWYALSHMLVTLPLALWAATIGAAGAWRSPAVWLTAALVFAAGLAVEVGRKLKAPEDEHPLAASYTQALGVAAATTLLGMVFVAAAALALASARALNGEVSALMAAASAAAVMLCLAPLASFRGRPSAAEATRLEAGVGLGLAALFLALIVATSLEHGLVWR